MTKHKLKIYKTIVKSVLTYNYSTWGLTKAEIEKSHKHEEGGAHLRISFWHLLMN